MYTQKMYIQIQNVTTYLYIQALLHVSANICHLQGGNDTKLLLVLYRQI